MATGVTIEIRTEAAQAALARIGRAVDAPTMLALVGQRHLAWINQNFRAGGAETRWAPLSPNTIAGRRGGGGGAQPLRDTGRLAQSFVVSHPSPDAVAVGTADVRARWHHEGTAPRTIVARRAQALRFVTVGGVVFRKSVKHPGLPARPLLPSQALAESLASRVLDAYLAKVLAQAEGRG